MASVSKKTTSRMEQSQRVTRSMQRQNSNTVDHVTKRFGRVSTEENTVIENETVSPPRKHKLSTSEEPYSTKKIKQLSKDEGKLKEITKAVLTKLLSKNTEKTPHRKSRRKRKKSSPLACNFNDQQHPVKHNAGETSGPSSLNFDDDDIEADGAGPSTGSGRIETDGGVAATEIVHQKGSSLDPKVIEEAALKLRAIGDKTNSEVTQAVIKAALRVVKDKCYKKYKETLEFVVNDSQHHVNDSSERFAVAIVYLLTEKVVTKAKEALVPSSTVDELVEIATEFIAAKYPGWLGQ